MTYLVLALVAVILALLALSYSFIPSQLMKGRILREQARGCEEKVLYLTFDDGPGEYTPGILDVLRENHVKAAFFIVGDFAEKMPQVICRMKEEGHLVCIHGKTHGSLMFKGPKGTREEMAGTVRTMDRMGLKGKYYRPPWGHLNLFALWYVKKMDLQIVMWHLMVGDWKADVTEKELEDRLLEGVEPGSIICLHDGRGEEGAPARTVGALNMAIPKLKKEGYAFRRLDSRYERECFR